MTALEDHLSPLVCPSCGGPVTYHGEALRCTACSETVPVADGIPQFPVAVDDTATSGFFDQLSSIYETPLWFPVMYRAIVWPRQPPDDRRAVASFLDGGTILDVACGTGRFTRYAATEAANTTDGADTTAAANATDAAETTDTTETTDVVDETFVWGIDTSMGMLRRARRYAAHEGVENVGFARMDAEHLQFGTDSFDGVACCWALHLFPDVPRAAAEVRRVLVPGGGFAGVTLCESGLLAAPGTQETLGRTVGARVFDREELRTLLVGAGFEAVGFERRGAALFFGAR